MPTLRNDKTFTNEGVPSGHDFKRGGVTPGIKARKKRRKSQRNIGERPGSPESLVCVIHEEEKHEPVSQSVVTRPQGKIRCLAFGKYQRTLYPGCFWCSHCDYWEQNGLLMGKAANMESRNFACQAKHTGIIFPTHVAPVYLPLKQLYDIVTNKNGKSQAGRITSSKRKESLACYHDRWDTNDEIDDIFRQASDKTVDTDNDDDNNNKDDSPSMIATESAQQYTSKEMNNEQKIAKAMQQNDPPTSTLPFAPPPIMVHHPPSRESLLLKIAYAEIETLKTINIQLNRKYESTKPKLSRLQQQHTAEVGSCTNLTSSLHAAATRLGLRGSSLVQQISDAAFNVFGGKAKEALIKHSKKILHDTVFSPFNIARLMDLTGGILNLSCIELLRSLETKGKMYERDTILPSSASIQKSSLPLNILEIHKFHFQYCRVARGKY